MEMLKKPKKEEPVMEYEAEDMPAEKAAPKEDLMSADLYGTAAKVATSIMEQKAKRERDSLAATQQGFKAEAQGAKALGANQQSSFNDFMNMYSSSLLNKRRG
jgi:hypothetical protein